MHNFKSIHRCISGGGFFNQMTTTNTLIASLSLDRIRVKRAISSRKRLLEEMANTLVVGLNEEIKEKDVYHLLLEREKLGNTGVGNGVAIPHSRCSDLDDAVVAIITLEEPVDYDSLDRQPVNVAFGLLVPIDARQEHLNLLADIAKLMSNPSNREVLASTESEKHVIDLLKNWSVI